MTTTFNADLPDRADYVAAIFINASPEKVWSALTTKAEAQHVFGSPTEFGEQGAAWTGHAVGDRPAVTGTVLVKDPPHRLLITWGFDGDPPPDRVEFLIERAGDLTKLTLKEYCSRRYPQNIMDSGVIGWAAILSALKTYAETGKPMPFPI